jgi:hypothetical protein
MLFDLDAMPAFRLFSHNRFDLVGFYGRDHLTGLDVSLAPVSRAGAGGGRVAVCRSEWVEDSIFEGVSGARLLGQPAAAPH